MTHEADLDALLGLPWSAAAMARRLALARGSFLVTDEVEALVAAVLERFAQPPERAELVAFLAGWEPPAPPSAVPAAPRRAKLDLGLDGRLDERGLCRLLGVDFRELAWFADDEQRSRRSAPVLQHYSWRVLPKRDGVRLVAAPKTRLKEIQRRLLRHVLAPFPLHPAAHGAVPGHNVSSAVAPHAGATVLVRVDLEAFFPTITRGRVRGLLSMAGLSGDAVDVVADLCTTAVPVAVWRDVPRPRDPLRLDAHARLGGLLRTPHLPQGAPTSPLLANAVAYGLDRRLAGLAGRYDAQYTRYVDDLTFSGGSLLRRHRHAFLDQVAAVVRDEGFRVNEPKTAVLSHGGRLSALGAVLNVRPTLPREERDRLRAILHNCRVHGGASQARGRPRFREELLGRIAAANSLDPVLGARLRAAYDRIEW